jgi:predicted ATPase
MVRANHAVLAELEQEEERLAEHVQDAHLLVYLHAQLTTLATFRGLHARAQEHYRLVLRHHNPQTPSLPRSSFGGDPLLVASTWSSLSLSLAGQPDLGWSRIAQALARAEELNQPLNLVNGLTCAAIVKLLRGDYDEAQRFTQKIDALAREYHFALYRIAGLLLHGCTAVQRGTLGEGIAGITTGLPQYHVIGAQHLLPFFLSFLAEGYRRQEKIDKALQVVSEALSLTATNFDLFWEAELHRLKGELLLQQLKIKNVKLKNTETKRKGQNKLSAVSSRLSVPSPQEAEACFQQAIEITRQQGAKLLELRAVTSLARLWQQRGKHHEAHRMLSEIYSWFTEGFDTADLQTAKSLLAEWSASP